MYLRTCFEMICEKEASELKLIISNRFSSYKDNIKYGKKSVLFAHIEEMVHRTVAVAYLIVRTGRYSL